MMKIQIILLLCWMAVIIRPVFSEEAHSENKVLNCADCHSCAKPAKENPCLKPCPRNTSQVLPLGKSGPDVVILNELQQIQDLYVPVRFNHQTHAHMSSTVDGCEMCHHYNDNRLSPEKCGDCHPREILHENLAQPGLKGAYHRQCMGCHLRWDPNTDCIICHEKNASGPLHGVATTYTAKNYYSPVVMQDLLVYKTGYEENDTVPFHHKRHAEMYDKNCGDCHHQQSCEDCHNQNRAALQPMGDISPEKMHDQCFVCHGNDDCTQCHGREKDKVFSHDSTGWPLKGTHAKLHCLDCHTERGVFAKLDTQCISCHAAGWNLEKFNHGDTGVALNDVHQQADCSDCHGNSIKIEDGKGIIQQKIVQAKCDSCHDDKRKFDPDKGFSE